MKSGSELIAEERQRQVSAEGWTPEHDDKHDIDYALNRAADGYLQAACGASGMSQLSGSARATQRRRSGRYVVIESKGNDLIVCKVD